MGTVPWPRTLENYRKWQTKFGCLTKRPKFQRQRLLTKQRKFSGWARSEGSMRSNNTCAETPLLEQGAPTGNHVLLPPPVARDVQKPSGCNTPCRSAPREIARGLPRAIFETCVWQADIVPKGPAHFLNIRQAPRNIDERAVSAHFGV